MHQNETLAHSFYPAKWFDMIGGCGAGGILAVLFGRLGMSIQVGKAEYLKLIQEVFCDKNISRAIFGGSAFKATSFEKALKRILVNSTGNANEGMIGSHTGDKVCKVFVVAMSKRNMNAGIPAIFRTYQGPSNQTPDCAIWQALRATCAHPDLFKSIRIGSSGVQEAFVDGGIGCSNPTAQLLSEARMMFPGRHISAIISIGAGHVRTIQIPKPSPFQRILPLNFLLATKAIASDSERTAQDMATRFEAVPDFYFRFNVDQGTQDVGLGDKERLDEVAAHTTAYTRLVETNRRLDYAAKAIVGRRPIVPSGSLDGRIHTPQALASIRWCPPPSPVFTGQESVLDQMRACFFDGTFSRHVFVLHGLGGCGKSQIAFRFVEIFQGRFSDIIYVDATSRETIKSSLESFSMAKNVGKPLQSTLEWLVAHRESWLLDLNNLDDPSIPVNDYLPSCAHGDILITTRNRDLALLARGYHSGFRNFGYLALAIVQAGANIWRLGCSFRQYHEMYQKRRQAVLEEYRNLTVKFDEYQYTVFTTWVLSYERLGHFSKHLLHLLAYMHQEAISGRVFRQAHANFRHYTRSAALPSPSETSTWNSVQEVLSHFVDSDNAWDSYAFANLMSELQSYSLLEFDPCNQAFSVHPLVQEWARTMVEDRAHALAQSSCLLAASIGEDEEADDYAFRRTLVPHVDEYMKKPGRNKAEQLELQVMSARRLTLGDEHPHTLATMGNLAFTLSKQGRYDEAEVFQTQVADIRKRTMGEHHPDTLTSLSNLASTYSQVGMWEDAEGIQVQVLGAMRKVLGDDHPNTLKSANNLARTYMALKRWDEAEALLTEALRGIRRNFGEEHPDTLTSTSNLALLYSKQGRWVDAERIQVQELKTSQKVLGEGHPDTLSSMNNLAATYTIQVDGKKRWFFKQGCLRHIRVYWGKLTLL